VVRASIGRVPPTDALSTAPQTLSAHHGNWCPAGDGSYEYSGGWKGAQRHGYGVHFEVGGWAPGISCVSSLPSGGSRADGDGSLLCSGCSPTRSNMGLPCGVIVTHNQCSVIRIVNHQVCVPTASLHTARVSDPLPPPPTAARPLQVHGPVGGRPAARGGQVHLRRRLAVRWPVAGGGQVGGGAVGQGSGW